MMIDEFNKKYTDVFLKATDELVCIFEKINPKVQIKENFSNVLLKIYQCYMIDVFPGSNVLVKNQNFFSFSILCRSVFDITIQIRWILSLVSPDREEAIEHFLAFKGVGQYINKKEEKITTYQWQDLVIKEKFNYRKTALSLGIDLNDFTDETTFDYLSRVLHWNPKIINDLVGVQNGHLAFGPKKLCMFFVASSQFINCLQQFIIIFVEHFYPNETCYYLELEKVHEIQKNFMDSIYDIVRLDSRFRGNDVEEGRK